MLDARGNAMLVFRHFREKCLGINSSPSSSNNFPSPQYPLVKGVIERREIDCDGDDLNLAIYSNDMRMILGRRKMER